MHLPPNPPPERSFTKLRFGLILIATAGAFLGLFVSSNSASVRVDASEKIESDRQLSTLLKEREKFQQQLQPKKEEIKSEPSPKPPEEIFAIIEPVPRLNLQETSPSNLLKIGGDRTDRRTGILPVEDRRTGILPVREDRRTGILPVDEKSILPVEDRRTGILPVREDIPPVDETEEADLTTDFLQPETDKIDRRTGILPVNKKPPLIDEKPPLIDEKPPLIDENSQEPATKTETSPIERWNLPPRNSAADLLANGSTSGRETNKNRSEEVLETSAESEQNAGIVITLNDAILLALENNRNLKNQYLDRIVDRDRLEVAEDIFSPNFTPEASLQIDGRDNNILPFPNSGGLNLSTDVDLRLPNGATITLNWNTNSRLEGSENAFNSIGQNLGVTLTQPLLRGAGSEINRLPIKIARLQETNNVLQLKSTVIDTVTNVIKTYRGLVQSQQQLEIQEKALENARERLERTELLIELGRIARVEAVSIQQEISGAELAVLRARSNLASQKLSLVQILDIERQIEVVAEDFTEVETPSLNLEEITQLALLNQPSYLQEQIAIERAELDMLEAEDALRWKLDLSAGYNNAINTVTETSGDFLAGINLSQEFGNMKERKLQLKESQIGLIQAQNNLLEARQSLEIDVVNAVRDVTLSLQEVKLARQATELAEELLKIEEDKLKFGVGNVRAQDVVDAQERVVGARNAELNAKIDYQNSLTDLSQILGTTLDELGIEFDDGLGEVVFEED
ncbi:MAG: TolC family protein [Cyanobacteriota bacterium]|nr:TolC family protein [Cyanobacteriota bacterium]